MRRFEKSKGVYFTKYTGIDVKTITDLRKSFRENNVEYVVSKNTLKHRCGLSYESGRFTLSIFVNVGSDPWIGFYPLAIIIFLKKFPFF